MFHKIIVASLLAVVFMGVSSPVLAQGAPRYSVNSVIVEEAEGIACLGQERSRAQTQKMAWTEVKRVAAESASTHISSETTVLNNIQEKDLIDAYSKGEVRILRELKKGWFQTDGAGGFVDSCYRVKVKAEVIPVKGQHVKTFAKAAMDNPRAPLTVELWTDKDSYRVGEVMKFYFRGNKPFYARAVYKDAQGHLIEVTPHQVAKYYKGGITYEIPGDTDRFVLMITPPLGNEKLFLYASTRPIDSYQGDTAGDLYIVRNQGDLGQVTRGLTVMHGVSGTSKPGYSEFAEAEAKVEVRQ